MKLLFLGNTRREFRWMEPGDYVRVLGMEMEVATSRIDGVEREVIFQRGASADDLEWAAQPRIARHIWFLWKLSAASLRFLEATGKEAR